MALWGLLPDVGPTLRRAVLWVAPAVPQGCPPSLCSRDLVTWRGARSDGLCAVQGWPSLRVSGKPGVELTSQSSQGTGLELRLLLGSVILAPRSVSRTSMFQIILEDVLFHGTVTVKESS